ncbi:hypothetical protein R0K05_25315, partial [Planococcus sp. SIMBA_160]
VILESLFIAFSNLSSRFSKPPHMSIIFITTVLGRLANAALAIATERIKAAELAFIIVVTLFGIVANAARAAATDELKL